MKVKVELTKEELAEMDVSVDQLKSGVIETLDGGIDINGGSSRLYLAGFNVEVIVGE